MRKVRQMSAAGILAVCLMGSVYAADSWETSHRACQELQFNGLIHLCTGQLEDGNAIPIPIIRGCAGLSFYGAMALCLESRLDPTKAQYCAETSLAYGTRIECLRHYIDGN